MTELVPSGGVWGGGSLVSVRGENFADSCDPASCELLCRFGGMGNATVEAEFISATEVRCVAPPADAAELADELRLDFDGDDAADTPRMTTLPSSSWAVTRRSRAARSCSPPPSPATTARCCGRATAAPASLRRASR